MSLLAPSTCISPRNSWEFVKERAAPIQRLPPELILHIFGFLSLEQLGRTACVCRDWKILSSDSALWNAFDLKKLFPSLKVIDETVWQAHVDLAALGLEAKSDSPFDKQEISILKKLFTSLEIEGDSGITLLTMPKGLTFKKLQAIAESPKRGYSTRVYFGPHMSETLGNIPVDKTYKIALTNSVLKGTRGASVGAKLEWFVSKEDVCEMPEALPAATLAILTYISSREKPPMHHDHPWTYVRCLEQYGGYDVVVGGFIPGCLQIESLITVFGKGFEGMGVQRKF